MKAPFFSVIIPTYNRAHILDRAIRSVLMQSFRDFELIVVDDGSTDGTMDFIEHNTEKGFQYIVQSNQGVCAARNKGVSLASGSYLIFLDSDDLLAEGALQLFYNGIISSKADLAHGKLLMNNPNQSQKTIDPRDPYNTGRKSNAGVQLSGSFALRKELFIKAGGYDENIAFGENTELFWRIKKQNFTSHIIDSIVVIVFQEADRPSKSSENLVKSLRYVINKHSEYLMEHPHIKWLYLNKLGVAYLRLNLKKEAMLCFVKAIMIKPLRFKSYFRLLGCPINYTRYV